MPSFFRLLFIFCNNIIYNVNYFNIAMLVLLAACVTTLQCDYLDWYNQNWTKFGSEDAALWLPDAGMLLKISFLFSMFRKRVLSVYSLLGFL